MSTSVTLQEPRSHSLVLLATTAQEGVRTSQESPRHALSTPT